ncbi:nuclear transcription factor, X-box binding [Dorcoceras hygrometricum]|uniref:Nuclear transcription factor, X-box binding n=1 Tax=Dorcoceras hygrometricum TaxID=472368 RepID=A0A2Z7D832_9LAMI|nr:nuclear transcription factor, X-box binding [Dorcoceras hygrometricum]
MREFRVTSCWCGKTVEEVERRRFVKLKRCVLEPSSEGIVSNALRLENQQSIRQRFAFTLKIQQIACAMIKPAGSHSYLEPAETSYWTVKPALTNKEFSSWTFSKENPTADDLAKQFQQQRFSSNDQAVTNQQQRKFSRGDFFFSTKKLEYLDAKQDCCTGNFTSESRRDLSRVQSRCRAVTIELRESEKQQFCTPKLCGNFSGILSQSSVQATNQQVRDLGRIRETRFQASSSSRKKSNFERAKLRDWSVNHRHDSIVIWVYGIFRISGLLGVTNGLDPLEEQNLGTDQ